MKLKGMLILALAATAILWSCGAGSMFSKDSSPKKDRSKEKDGQIFYSASEGLKLYPEPRFSQNTITELPLNEKVLRYRVDKGFAYIKVERTGQKGWVDNALLKWRIEEQEIEPKMAVPEEKQETPSDQPSPEPQEDKKKAVDVVSPKEAEAAPPPKAKKQPDSTTKKPDASVLDSY